MGSDRVAAVILPYCRFGVDGASRHGTSLLRPSLENSASPLLSIVVASISRARKVCRRVVLEQLTEFVLAIWTYNRVMAQERDELATTLAETRWYREAARGCAATSTR